MRCRLHSGLSLNIGWRRRFFLFLGKGGVVRCGGWLAGTPGTAETRSAHYFDPVADKALLVTMYGVTLAVIIGRNCRTGWRFWWWFRDLLIVGGSGLSLACWVSLSRWRRCMCRRSIRRAPNHSDRDDAVSRGLRSGGANSDQRACLDGGRVYFDFRRGLRLGTLPMVDDLGAFGPAAFLRQSGAWRLSSQHSATELATGPTHATRAQRLGFIAGILFLGWLGTGIVRLGHWHRSSRQRCWPTRSIHRPRG